MLTINGEPFDLSAVVENEIEHLRNVKRDQAKVIKQLKAKISYIRKRYPEIDEMEQALGE